MSTVIVTSAQVAAAKVMVKRLDRRGEHASDALFAIANATKVSVPKEVSTNMIHARELDINAITTVSELFELIDLPYRITKHAQLRIVSKSSDPASPPIRVLRLEWRGEPE